MVDAEESHTSSLYKHLTTDFLVLGNIVHRAVAISLITSGRNKLRLIFLYHCEARQMPEVIEQKPLQLEPVLGSYGACEFSHIFPVEKPFNYNPLKLPSRHMFMTCM